MCTTHGKLGADVRRGAPQSDQRKLDVFLEAGIRLTVYNQGPK